MHSCYYVGYAYWSHTLSQQTSNILIGHTLSRNVNFQQTYFTPSVKRFTILRTWKFILNSRLFQFGIYSASVPHLRHFSPRLCNFVIEPPYNACNFQRQQQQLYTSSSLAVFRTLLPVTSTVFQLWSNLSIPSSTNQYSYTPYHRRTQPIQFVQSLLDNKLISKWSLTSLSFTFKLLYFTSASIEFNYLPIASSISHCFSLE